MCSLPLFLSSIGCALIALSGCVPSPSTQSQWANTNLEIPKRYDATAPPVMEVRSGLLSLFPSQNLRNYVNKALQNNPDLRSSAAALEESGFNITVVNSARLPSLTATGLATRATTVANGLSNNRTTTFSASLDAQWELDVWGRIRAGVTASSRDLDAAAADYAFARESIAAQTVQAYFDLVAAQKRLALSKRRLSSFQSSFDLVSRRFEAGTGNLGDLDLARTDLESTKSQVAAFTDSRDQSARNLAVLTGSYPDASAIASSWPSLKGGVRKGLPSDILMNRPDIDAAYQRIRAADARVQVAHRDLYPSFTLTASGGRESSLLSDLADSNFNVWSLVAGLSAPLIDGGERRAELGAVNARAKRALADYQSIVLNAFREVENALGSEKYLLEQEQATRRALNASRSAEQRVKRNYESGLTEILTLLDTQRRSFEAEEALINVIAQRYINRVTLALALGKGL